MDCLAHENPSVRSFASGVLSQRRSKQDDVVAAMIERLLSPSEEVRFWASRVLSRMGGKGTAALWATLDSPDPAVRKVSVEALGEEETDISMDLPRVVRLMEDPAFGVREAALMALKSLGPAAEAVLPEVCALLRDPHPMVRQQAVWTLADISPHKTAAAEQALQTLGALPKDPREG